MGRSYDEAADAAKDRGVLDPEDVTRQQVQARMQDFLSVEDPNSAGARRLIDEATDSALDQTVTFTSAEGRAQGGGTLGKRRDVNTYTDRWGNLMGINSRTGTRRKLVDSEDR